MKGRSIKKLRSRAGETIAETLISTLIAAVALTMLAGAISATESMVMRSEYTMGTYLDVNNALADRKIDGNVLDTSNETATSYRVEVQIKEGAKDVWLYDDDNVINENAPISANCVVNTTIGGKAVVAYEKTTTP